MVALIRRMVECESPSDDPAAVNRFVELVADAIGSLARVKTVPGGRFGRHLVAEMTLPGRKKSGQILALGHSDTVWPLGTLRTMPFREAEGRLWGPGVLDMKSGIAFFIFAVRALRELEIPVASKVLLQLNSDEEVGSESSRPLTEKNAARSHAVLVLEPGTGLAGKLKTARKGVGEFHRDRPRRASHAGVDFAAGASAVLELARQIDRIAGFTDPAPRHHRQPRRDFRRHAIQRGGRRSACRNRHPRPAPQRCPHARKKVPRPEALRPPMHPRRGRRPEPPAHGALGRHRAAVPQGASPGARAGRGDRANRSPAAAPTAISPPRSAFRRWTAWAALAKARMPPTRAS